LAVPAPSGTGPANIAGSSARSSGINVEIFFSRQENSALWPGPVVCIPLLLLDRRSRFGTIWRWGGLSRRHRRRSTLAIWLTEVMRTLRTLVHFPG